MTRKDFIAQASISILAALAAGDGDGSARAAVNLASSLSAELERRDIATWTGPGTQVALERHHNQEVAVWKGIEEWASHYSESALHLLSLSDLKTDIMAELAKEART